MVLVVGLFFSFSASQLSHITSIIHVEQGEFIVHGLRDDGS